MRRVTVYYFVEDGNDDDALDGGTEGTRYRARVARVSWKHFETAPGFSSTPSATRATKTDAVALLRNMIKEELRFVVGDRLTLKECD